jgi:hypothetical protein
MAASDHAWVLKPDHESETDLQPATRGGYDPRKRLLLDAPAHRIGATS